MCEDTNLKAIHNSSHVVTIMSTLSSMCEDTNLKAIHNTLWPALNQKELSSMCEDTNLKAIHNAAYLLASESFVVFNVRRY